MAWLAARRSPSVVSVIEQTYKAPVVRLATELTMDPDQRLLGENTEKANEDLTKHCERYARHTKVAGVLAVLFVAIAAFAACSAALAYHEQHRSRGAIRLHMAAARCHSPVTTLKEALGSGTEGCR